MKNQPLLIGTAWTVSLLAAYFIGTSTSSTKSLEAQTAGGKGANAAESASAEGKTDRAMVQKAGEFSEQGKETKGNVALIVGRARLQMGGSMGMMNIRGMLRAMAPLAELDDTQLQEALAEVERTVREPQQKMMFYSMLLGQWAEKDGKAALAYADEKLGTGSPFDMGVRSSIVGSWAQHDPDAAWRWFQTERKDDGKTMNQGMMVSTIFSAMAGNNLDAALQRLSGLDETNRGMALGGIARSATDEASRARLLERSASLPAEQRTQIQSSVAGMWAMSDPDAAVKWIRQQPAEEQKGLRDAAGNTLMMTKPALGAELMLEGAKDEDKARIYEQTTTRWAYQDPKGAGEWLMKQPQGPELDGARRNYAMAVAQKDPAAAMDWAKSVQKEETRVQSVEQVYTQWRMKDAAAANAALDEAGLPEEKVKKLKEAPVPQTPAKTVRGFGF